MKRYVLQFSCRLMVSSHFLMALLVALSTATSLGGQTTSLTNQTSTPIPGAGHDYIHLLGETVNPANGTVSLRISPPTRKGRGISIPFSFGYDSGSAVQAYISTTGGTGWTTNQGYLSEGGWSYSVPMANISRWNTSGTTTNGLLYQCWYANGIIFKDAGGGVHSLPLGVGDSNIQNGGGYGSYTGCKPANSSYIPDPTTGKWPTQSGGDGQVYGNLSCASRPCASPTLSISDADGTVYGFGLNIPDSTAPNGANVYYGLAGMEDRNGNIIGITSETQAGSFSYNDTLGTPIISVTAINPSTNTNSVTIGDLTYQLAWRTTSSQYTVGNQRVNAVPNVSCTFTTSVNLTQLVIDHITLPNGQVYQFYYGDNNPDSNFNNPYGLLSEIEYPDGGWVKYKWGLPTTTQGAQIMNEYMELDGYVANGTPPNYPDGCQVQYQAPVVLSRTVGFTSATTPVLTQAFSYQVNWNTPAGYPNSGWTTLQWTTKVTTVTDTDPLYGSKNTVYTYLPIGSGSYPNFGNTPYGSQIPVEQSVQYYDWGNATVAKTTTKTWLNQYTLASEQTQYANVSAAKKVYCYVGQSCLKSGTSGPPATSINQLQELDEYDFGGSSPVRWTVYTYQAFTGVPGVIANKVCKEVVSSTGGAVAETDSYYDGGATLCSEPTTPAAGSAVPAGFPSYTIAGSSYSTHDDVNFGASSHPPRGNMTKQVHVLSGGTSPTTTYTYDVSGQIATITDPCGNATCTNMNGSSHKTTYSFTDAPSTGNSAGNTNAYLTSVTDQLSHSQSFTYDYTTGNVLSSTDANSQATNYSYNTQGSQCSQAGTMDRITEIDYPDGGTTQYCYDDTVPNVTTAILLSGSTWKTDTSTMDGLGHVTQAQLISDPYPNGTTPATTYSTYDGEGRVYQAYNPTRCNPPTTNCGEATWGITTYKYDALSRPTSVQHPDGSIKQWCYDNSPSGHAPCNAHIVSSAGIWVDESDENSNDWQRTTDGLGRLISVIEPSGGAAGTGGSPTLESDYSYDTLGNLMSVSQKGAIGGSAVARSRSFSYDGLSRLICASNPESATAVCPSTLTSHVPGTVGYVYDANGNVQSKTDARGVTTNFHYDNGNRLTSKTYTSDPSGTPLSCYQYDAASVTRGIGRLANVWTLPHGGSCTTTLPGTGFLSVQSILVYDEMGRVKSATQQHCVGTTCSGPTPYSLTFLYDSAGDVKQFTNSVGAQNAALTLINYFDAAAQPCLTTSSWTTVSSPNVFQVNPSLSAPGYTAPGNLSNWYLGSNLATASTACSTSPTSSINLQQKFDSRLRLTNFSSTGQVP